MTLNTASAVGTFASAQVGNNISVQVTGLTISGAQAANYVVSQPVLAANITPQPPTVSVNSVMRLAGTSGLTPFTFQVKLSGGGSAKGPVTFDVFTTDGTARAGVNYVAIKAGDAAHGGTVTFLKGAIYASVTVYVIAGSIPVAAGTKTFNVNLADPLYLGVALSSGTGTIIPQLAKPAAAPASTLVVPFVTLPPSVSAFLPTAAPKSDDAGIAPPPLGIGAKQAVSDDVAVALDTVNRIFAALAAGT